MKNLAALFVVACLLASFQSSAQTFSAIDKDGVITSLTSEKKDLPEKDWTINVDHAGSKNFEVLLDDEKQSAAEFAFRPSAGGKQSLVLEREKIKGRALTIREAGQSTVLVQIKFAGDDTPEPLAPDARAPLAKTASAWVLTHPSYAKKLVRTPHGLQLKDGKNYVGSNFVHLFFDGSGHSILTTVPQGIANKQYVVHLVYLAGTKTPYQTTYSVDQKTGTFEGALVLQGDLSKIPGFLTSSAADNMEWAEEVILLSTSTTDIEFDLKQTTIAFANGKTNTTESTTLATHKIKMTTVYHGAFNIGLLNTRLADPTYELAQLAAEPAKQTVLEKNAGDRGLVTLMAVLYTSPVIALENLLGKDRVPNIQLHGRNYLQDHKWFERIYPTVGVRLNDKVFENLFFGVTFEVARGGSLFAGAHYARRNVFNGPFDFGKEAITAEQFAARLDQEWKADWTFGASIDIAIVSGLVRSK